MINDEPNPIPVPHRLAKRCPYDCATHNGAVAA